MGRFGLLQKSKKFISINQIISKRTKFKLPNTLKEIKKLPGVGDYTANALMGFIHNYPTIALDGNVKRVFTRYLNKKSQR